MQLFQEGVGIGGGVRVSPCTLADGIEGVLGDRIIEEIISGGLKQCSS